MFYFVDPTYFFLHGTISKMAFCVLTLVNRGSRQSLRLGEKSLDLAHYRLLLNVDGSQKYSYNRWTRLSREGSLDWHYIPTTPIIYSSFQRGDVSFDEFWFLLSLISCILCFRNYYVLYMLITST